MLSVTEFAIQTRARQAFSRATLPRISTKRECAFLTAFSITMKVHACLHFSCLLITIDWTALCRAFLWPSIWEVTNLTAVTRFKGIDKYYVSLRAQYGEHDAPPQEVVKARKKAEIKKAICKSIFSSHHFKMYERTWVDVDDDETLSELESYNKSIFDRLFNADLAYENVYVSRQVCASSQEGAFNEHLFVCPARNPSTKNIEEYLVSREYDVNVVEDHNDHPIAGRFIFKRNDRGDLVLLAMAEQGATPLLPWPLRNALVANFFNLYERYDEELYTELNGDPVRDPICFLEVEFKLRLCSILFGAHEFADKVIYMPTMSSVLPKCQAKPITVIGARPVTRFLDRYLRPSWGRIFEEWVIGCAAMDKASKKLVIYYVSRGSWDNTIFVYTDAGNKSLSAYNYFFNVSVADAR